MTTKQQEKSRQTQQELKSAGMALFREKGFLETSVAEITQRAGYAKGNFYRHWDSKDDLFLEIVEDKLQRYRNSRDRVFSDATNLEEALRFIWDFLENMVADHNWAKVFLEFTVQAARKPELRTELNQSKYRLSNKVFAGLVRDFVETDYPPEKIGAMNTALFEGFMVHNALETGVLTLEDVREAAITLALSRGVKQPE
ncbi:TetR/AcrR family transcriptional regulator [Pseudodesulfovibrio tunisiensis]|uniref:TetR/AcrR family transcriptional regulator n=1 Tax=Pseudodesulfovibrio tunisiensis TaxID=463192 RepID=UPI001FB3D7B0|nr:TetR/AcrR family transcriptional regulator [Pseudodesulfovibrio tunisiensis]